MSAFKMKNIVILPILLLVLSACQSQQQKPTDSGQDTGATIAVTARAETSATLTNGANDPAIIVNASQPSNSMIIGSDAAGGLELYTLSGERVSVNSSRPIGLVDVSYNFALAGEKIPLIIAYDIAAAELVAYTINFDSRTLQQLPTEPILTNVEVEGLCLYTSSLSGKLYAFANGGGMLQQWELFDNSGQLAARQIRVIPVGKGSAHCVASERNSTLYYTQETVGVWKMNAEPESDSIPELIDFLTPNGRYTGDVKGIALYESADGSGYLLASDADASQLQIYDLETNAHVGTLSVTSSQSIDSVEESEALSATSMSLGGNYTNGLLVVTDDDNEDENTNYKLIPWSEITSSLKLDSLPGHNPTTPVVQQTITVSASVETTPVSNYGDAADDPAIWVHPDKPQLSLVLGTQKQRGIMVYDLDGNLLQELPIGRINNIDVRYGFMLGGKSVDIVTGSNRSNESIAIYTVDPQARVLIDISAGLVATDMGDPYGLCMYKSQQTGHYYVFVNDTDGLVKQWLLEDNGKGRINARPVRQFSVGSQTEGCVADDETGMLYVGEENVAIWKYSAEPDGGDNRILVDSVAEGEITDDVEGMAIYYGANGDGYLIVSNQGADNYAIYERSGNNKFLGIFHVVSDEVSGIDGVSETDGLDVTSAYLGPAFPHGVFVAQDGRNISPAERQNFKLVPWERIAAAMGLKLFSDYNPRTD